jgi:hypothetical protein
MIETEDERERGNRENKKRKTDREKTREILHLLKFSSDKSFFN